MTRDVRPPRGGVGPGPGVGSGVGPGPGVGPGVPGVPGSSIGPGVGPAPAATLLGLVDASLQAIMDAVPAGVVACDRSGRITLINETARELLPGAGDEISVPDDCPLSRTARDGVRTDGVPVTLELPDGGSRLVSCSAKPLRDAHGRVIGAVGAFSDVTSLAQVRAERERLVDELAEERARLVEQHQAVQERATQLRVVMESLHEGIVALDASHRLIFWSRTAAEMFGVAYEDFGKLASCMREGLRGLDGAALPREAWPDYRLMAGECIDGEELLGTHVDGHLIRLALSGRVVSDEHGRVSLAVIAYRDVTALRELERAKDEFLQILAHELRNPLAAACGIIEFVRRRLEAGDSDRAAEYLVMAEGELGRLSILTREITTAYRISAGRLPLDLKELDLAKVLVQAAATYVYGDPDHDIRVSSPPQGGLPVRGDEKRLLEVFVNLLSNAVKYSPRGSRIWVESLVEDDQVVVKIEDEGMGIPPDQLEDVFQGFFRGSNIPDRQPGGVGLGLYISRDTARRHGGDLWAENRPGGGTVMVLRLPRA